MGPAVVMDSFRLVTKINLPARSARLRSGLSMKQTLIPTLCLLAHSLIPLQAASLEVDKQRSHIQVDARATAHSFTGTLKAFEAKVTGDASSLKPTGFDLSWKFSDLDSAEPKRDAEMIKWLGDADPKGSFKFIKSWTDNAGKDNGMGTLTIHGVSKTIAFPYTVKQESGLVTIDGKVVMDYQNFNLPIVRAMAVMTVDPKLEVSFHIVGKIR